MAISRGCAGGTACGASGASIIGRFSVKASSTRCIAKIVGSQVESGKADRT